MLFAVSPKEIPRQGVAMEECPTNAPSRPRTAHTAFADNQLSPRLIGLSPLSPTRPSLLQQTRVRASKDLAASFTLVRDRSRGFGSDPQDYDGLPPRFHYACALSLAEAHALEIHSLVHYAKGTPW